MPKRKLVHSRAPFGPRLAELRNLAGFTQRELAKVLGISQRMVAYYEGQTDHPPAQLLPALSQLLGLSVDELLGMKPVKAPAAKATNQQLWRRLKQIEKLPASERKQLLGVIDAFLDRNRLIREAS